MKIARIMLCALLLAAAVPAGTALAKSVMGEYVEGRREIQRERDEMRRNILNSDSRWEARQAYREGMREIRREKREMRREMRQAARRW